MLAERSGPEESAAGPVAKKRGQKPWLILPVEIQIRELSSKLLIACAAALRGYRVVLGEQIAVHRNFDRLPPGIIFEKSICPEQVFYLKKFREHGHKIDCFDEEANCVHDNVEFFLRIRLSEEALGIAERFFCWCEREKRVID